MKSIKHGWKNYNNISSLSPLIGADKPKQDKGKQKSTVKINPYAYGFLDHSKTYFQYDERNQVWVNRKTGKKIRKDAGIRLWNNAKKRFPKDIDQFKEEQHMKHKTNEGLADMADMAERDHEVQMARAELYKIAKYAIKLHEMLKGVSEAEGIEGWIQSKITKAADYMGSVYHTMDYDTKFDESVTEAKDTHCSDDCCGKDVKAEDCTCKPSCESCNCNAVSEGLRPAHAKELRNKELNKGKGAPKSGKTTGPDDYDFLKYKNAKDAKEGKSPHAKGSKKYKKHMAAMHAESRKDEYKSTLHARLAEKKK